MNNYLPSFLDTNRFYFQLMTLTNNNLRTIIKRNHEIDLLIGDFKWSIRDNDFNGWVICDGRSLSKTIYADLYSIIGSKFGSINDSTFKLPDCRGRTTCAAGKGQMLSYRQAGQYIGEEKHTLEVEELPAHNHTINDPGHVHTQFTLNDDFNNSGGGGPIPSFTRDSAGTITWNNINSATTGITINNKGGNQAHNIMQPSLFIGNLFLYTGVDIATAIYSFVDLNKVNLWTTDTNINYLASIPNWYSYQYDGDDFYGIKFNINDGNNDMYDTGNYISIESNQFNYNVVPSVPVTRSVSGGPDVSDNAIPYGIVWNKEDGTSGLFVSGETYPHLSMVYMQNGSSTIRVFGSIGSDGEASVSNYNGTYTCANERNGSYWANINWDGGDPTVGEVWFTILHPTWYSSINNVVDNRKTSDVDPCNQSMGVSGNNYIFCKVLLSKSQGRNILQTEVEGFLAAYVQQINLVINPDFILD